MWKWIRCAASERASLKCALSYMPLFSRVNVPTDQIVSADVDLLVHELGVHQIELEAQNEELVQTRAALEAARDRYLSLYQQAPVGYVTIGAP